MMAITTINSTSVKAPNDFLKWRLADKRAIFFIFFSQGHPFTAWRVFWFEAVIRRLREWAAKANSVVFFPPSLLNAYDNILASFWAGRKGAEPPLGGIFCSQYFI